MKKQVGNKQPPIPRIDFRKSILTSSYSRYAAYQLAYRSDASIRERKILNFNLELEVEHLLNCL